MRISSALGRSRTEQAKAELLVVFSAQSQSCDKLRSTDALVVVYAHVCRLIWYNLLAMQSKMGLKGWDDRVPIQSRVSAGLVLGSFGCVASEASSS